MMSNDEQITRDMLREAFDEGYRISFRTANESVMTSFSFRLPRPTPMDHLPLKHAYRVVPERVYSIGFDGNSLALYISDDMGNPMREAEPYIPAVGFHHGTEFMAANARL